MSRFTVLRVEVDSAVVERVLGLTPGVEVVEGFEAEGRAPRDEPAGPRQSEAADERLLDRATPEGDLLEQGSPIREYGLLGVGVSFVMLGVATVGIWWYRRRKGGSEAGPVEPSTTSFDRDTEPTGFDSGATGSERETQSADDGGASERETPPTGERDDTERGPSSTAGGDTDSTSSTDEASLSIVRPDEGSDEAEDERDETDEGVAVDGTTADEGVATGTDSDEARASRTADREDVEWTTKWDSEGPESDEREADEREVDTDERDDEAAPRASESVDVAPLLGVAFIAISGAVARWVSGDEE